MGRARLAPLLLAAGCAPRGSPGEPGSRALYELERLSFVPSASCSLPGNPSQDLSLTRAIVIDRFEFTRADLRHYWPQRRPRVSQWPWGVDTSLDTPEHADWPAPLDFHEAEELAELRGMRLPTPVEWLHVAVGRKDHQTPWGGPGREFFANTVVQDQDGVDFSLKSPCKVGTYENGKSTPFGCYDLLGNVWEWVDGIVRGYEPAPSGDSPADDLDDDLGTRTSVMGGAFDTLWRPTFQLDRSINQQRFHARRIAKRTLGPSFGARMCADAGSYLWSRAAEWGEGAAARERVLAVGVRWAEDYRARGELRAILAELRARPGAPAALAWLEEGLEGGP